MDLEGMEKLIKFGHEQNKEGIEELKEYSKEQFKIVKSKQDYTNGDVRSLKEWRAWQKGTIAVISFFGIFFLAILIDTIKKQNIKLEFQSSKIQDLSDKVRIESTSLLDQFEYRLEKLEDFTKIKEY